MKIKSVLIFSIGFVLLTLVLSGVHSAYQKLSSIADSRPITEKICSLSVQEEFFPIRGVEVSLLASHIKHYDSWDVAVRVETEKIVANTKSEVSSDKKVNTTYTYEIVPARAMVRKIGKSSVAAVLCEDSKPKKCRNRTYWSEKSVSGQQLAPVIFENIMTDEPSLRECRLQV